MSRRAKALTLCALCVVLLVGAWLGLRHAPAPPVRTPTEPVVSAIDTSGDKPRVFTRAAKATPAPTLTPTKIAPAELIDYSLPIDQSATRLREYADAGDPMAQIQLSRYLSQCTEHALGKLEKVDRDEHRRIESIKAAQNLDESQRAQWIHSSQLQLDRNAESRRACSQIPADLRAQWLDWIDRAARAGNVHALRQYGAIALPEFDSMDAILADPDAAIAERDKARTYLLEAFRLGDARSLTTFAEGYYDDGRHDSTQLFDSDPVKSYAYAYAGTLANLPERAWLERMMEDNERSLDAKKIADAREQGLRIYAQCCATQ